MQTIIEYKKIGKYDDDTYIVLINGREAGQWCCEDTAKKVTMWLRTAIGDLKNIL